MVRLHKLILVESPVIKDLPVDLCRLRTPSPDSLDHHVLRIYHDLVVARSRAALEHLEHSLEHRWRKGAAVRLILGAPLVVAAAVLGAHGAS